MTAGGQDEIGAAEALLATPPGLPGSGRVRYGAAMLLWQGGRLSPPALECYRICANLDGEDPEPLLKDVRETASRAIGALVGAALRYLSPRLPAEAEGVAEGLAQNRHGPPQATIADPRARSVTEAHMQAALAALAADDPALAAAIADALPHLSFARYTAYARDEIGADFADNHAFASVIGSDGAIAAPDFDLGLFLIAPHVLYRDHRHKAPELYAPLTGPHGWRFAPGAPLSIRPAHRPVWNAPDAPHLTKVGPLPFLAFYVWTRDTAEAAEVVPAQDWAALEKMRISPADRGA